MQFKNKADDTSVDIRTALVIFIFLFVTMLALEYFGSNADKNRKAEKHVIALQAENDMLRKENIRLLKHYEQSITALAKAGIKLE